MCTAKKQPQWCRITPCEMCPFYNAKDDIFNEMETPRISMD